MKAFMVLSLIITIALASVIALNHIGIIDIWGAATLMVIVIVFTVMAYEFNMSYISSKEVSLVAIISSLSAVSRVVFSPIPSVQPCTFLILATGYVFGPVSGFMVGVNTAFISNILLSQGPWTIFQMLAWGLVGVSGACIRRLRIERKGVAITGFIWGILFGWMMNLWYWLSVVYPHTLNTLAFVMVSSIVFDLLHAVGNVIFILLLWDKTILIMQRFKDRFHIGSLRVSKKPA
ncbi:MAG: ECF transporter S component [Candidatus Thermoplasmatota archaeon]